MAQDMPIRDIIAQTDILAVYERATGQSANGRKYPDYRLLRCFNTDVHSQGDRKPSLIVNTTHKHFTCQVGGCPERGKMLDLIIHAVPDVTNNSQAVNWLKANDLIGYAFDASKSPEVKLFGDEDFVSRDLTNTYTYKNADGQNHARVLRYRVELTDGTIDKDLRSYRWDSEKSMWIASTEGMEMLPYRLPQLISAAAKGSTVALCEGEGKVDALESLGFVATTNMGGSNIVYPPSWLKYFQGVRGVVIFTDCDKPGRKAAEIRAKFLREGGIATKVFDISPQRSDAYDIKDWIDERKGRPFDAIATELRSLYQQTVSLKLKAS